MITPRTRNGTLAASSSGWPRSSRSPARAVSGCRSSAGDGWEVRQGHPLNVLPGHVYPQAFCAKALSITLLGGFYLDEEKVWCFTADQLHKVVKSWIFVAKGREAEIRFLPTWAGLCAEPGEQPLSPIPNIVPYHDNPDFVNFKEPRARRLARRLDSGLILFVVIPKTHPDGTRWASCARLARSGPAALTHFQQHRFLTVPKKKA